MLRSGYEIGNAISSSRSEAVMIQAMEYMNRFKFRGSGKYFKFDKKWQMNC